MIDTVIQWMSNALETVKLISILDIIDICIVAYVVYRILLFIRRSRSGQVAKAILIIIIALAWLVRSGYVWSTLFSEMQWSWA